jgi:hypothetical protein
MQRSFRGSLQIASTYTIVESRAEYVYDYFWQLELRGSVSSAYGSYLIKVWDNNILSMCLLLPREKINLIWQLLTGSPFEGVNVLGHGETTRNRVCFPIMHNWFEHARSFFFFQCNPICMRPRFRRIHSPLDSILGSPYIYSLLDG